MITRVFRLWQKTLAAARGMRIRLRSGRIAISIRLRFFFYIALVLIIFTATFIASDIIVDLRSETAEEMERSRGVQNVVSALVSQYLPARHFLSLETLLEKMAESPDIVAIDIFDWQHKLVLDGDAKTSMGSLDVVPPIVADAYTSGKTLVRYDDGRITLAFAIPADGSTIATAHVVIRIPTASEIIWDLIKRSGWIVLIAVCAVVPMSWMLANHVLLPLQHLTNACRNVARGSIDGVVMVTQRRDEIGLLAARFNRMLAKIRGNLERIHKLAYIDGITELPNRAFFRRVAEGAIQRALASRRPGAILFIDLDRFKRVNDTLGHNVGDLLLQEVGQRLLNCVRSSDAIVRLPELGDCGEIECPLDTRPTIARLGGDEFSLLLPHVRQPTDAALVARRIIAAMEQPFVLDGHTLFTGASVGIATFPEDGTTLVDVLRAADLALYHAKDQGRGIYAFFSAALNEQALDRFNLENELRRALQFEEFTLYYQPIVDPRCGSLRSVEALLRWRHPLRGTVEPSEFIAVAEESGMIVDIGTWVLRAACRQAAEWCAQGTPVQVSVNISLAQFERAGFSQTVVAALTDAGLTPRLLCLEITESMAMSDPEHTATVIGPLRDAGISFALDDFGTGYSSLSVLSRLPIDSLKIDRTFIARVRDDADARVIVETILAMARSLKYETIAEGIEKPYQAEFLAARGCTLVQGYLYAQPLPSNAFAQLFLHPQAYATFGQRNTGAVS